MKPVQSVKNWIWQMAKPLSGKIVLISIIRAFTALSTVVFALLSQQVIDRAIGDAEGSLWVPGLLLVGALAIRLMLSVVYIALHDWICGKMEIRIKDRVFNTLFQKQWRDVTTFHSGDLLNRMTSDSAVVVAGVVNMIPLVVSIVVTVVASIIVLLKMSWKFTLVMLGIGGLMLLISRFYGRRMKQLHKDCQATDGDSKAFTQEAFANWMVIQSFGGSDMVRGRMDRLLFKNFKAKMSRAWWSSISHAAMFLVFNGSYYIALLWGALQIGGGMSFGTLTALLQIVSQIRAPFMNMSGVLPQYYNMLASAERIMELENLPDEPRLPQLYTAEELYSRLQTIDVADVRFSYDEDKEVLSGADFTLKKGEFVALAGYSGIGKSTLFKLMLGFYPPNMGTLTADLDGEILTLGADTRCLFAYVPQKNMLLSGTVRENIAFCCGDVDEDAIWAAAEVADVAEAIRQQPDGLDTVLGESGSGMSEGQLQRLAIARAVLSGAPILLLDECTASLDESTEERVLKNLRTLPGRTCLCISHRPAALDICDRVVRVVDGKIVEDG